METFVQFLTVIACVVILACALAQWRDRRRSDDGTPVRAFGGPCLACGQQLLWFGTWLDMPACSQCGWRPDRSQLERAQRANEEVLS